MPVGPAAAVPGGRAHADGAEHAVPRRGRATRKRPRALACAAEWRYAAGLTQPDLASEIGMSVTTVGHAETGRLWQSRRFWQRVDLALKAGGALLARYDAWRPASPPASTAGEPVMTTTPVLFDADRVLSPLPPTRYRSQSGGATGRSLRCSPGATRWLPRGLSATPGAARVRRTGQMAIAVADVRGLLLLDFVCGQER